jgi:hypothetical protein
MVKDEKDPRTAWRIEVGKRLILELERAKLSQTDLAGRLGHTKQLVNHWGTARSEITLWQLYCLDRLGLDTHFILTGKPASTVERAAASISYAPDPTELMRVAREINTWAEKMLRGSR